MIKKKKDELEDKREDSRRQIFFFFKWRIAYDKNMTTQDKNADNTRQTVDATR